jgi:hypothetical protein
MPAASSACVVHARRKLDELITNSATLSPVALEAIRRIARHVFGLIPCCRVDLGDARQIKRAKSVVREQLELG